MQLGCLVEDDVAPPPLFFNIFFQQANKDLAMIPHLRFSRRISGYGRDYEEAYLVVTDAHDRLRFHAHVSEMSRFQRRHPVKLWPKLLASAGTQTDERCGLSHQKDAGIRNSRVSPDAI